MQNLLGIDLGGQAVGPAVVRQPDNRIPWFGTARRSDKIKDLYDLRRSLRRAPMSAGMHPARTDILARNQARTPIS